MHEHAANSGGCSDALAADFLRTCPSRLPLLLVCVIPLTYLSVNLQFTLPLIIDKQMSFGMALKSSWTMAHRHWLQVFGLTIVVGLVDHRRYFWLPALVFWSRFPLASLPCWPPMKPSSAPGKISRPGARNATMMNLLGTPGLGSLMARRWFEGAGQLILFWPGSSCSVFGFSPPLPVITGCLTFRNPAGSRSRRRPRRAGRVCLCVLAWCWSLITSLSLKREASRVDVESLKSFAAGQIKFDPDQITSALATIPQWYQNNYVLTRTYEFKDFPAAMESVHAVARIAEQVRHHPDIDIRWNKVSLALNTHDAGGLTGKDFALARQCGSGVFLADAGRCPLARCISKHRRRPLFENSYLVGHFSVRRRQFHQPARRLVQRFERQLERPVMHRHKNLRPQLLERPDRIIRPDVYAPETLRMIRPDRQ